MNKLILTAVLTICLVGTAQASVTFSFDTVGELAGSAAIETYMEGLYGSEITVTNATAGSLGALGPDRYIFDAGTSSHWFTISFDAVPITSMTFDWIGQADSFYAQADGTQVFSAVNPGAGTIWGLGQTVVFSGPVTTLRFHDGDNGWVGIDNLTVTPIPAPGAILLGSIGVS